MSDDARSPKTTPHRHTASPPAMSYDGADLPVLIRIPDLSVTHSEKPSDAADSTADSTAESAAESRGSGRKRRQHRGHWRRDEAHQQEQPGVAQTSRSKRRAMVDGLYKPKGLLAALVIAAVGLTYVLTQGDRQPEQPPTAEDPWLSVEIPAEPPSTSQHASTEAVPPNTDAWTRPDPSADVAESEIAETETEIAETEPRDHWSKRASEGAPEADSSEIPLVGPSDTPTFSLAPQIADQAGPVTQQYKRDRPGGQRRGQSSESPSSSPHTPDGQSADEEPVGSWPDSSASQEASSDQDGGYGSEWPAERANGSSGKDAPAWHGQSSSPELRTGIRVSRRPDSYDPAEEQTGARLDGTIEIPHIESDNEPAQSGLY